MRVAETEFERKLIGCDRGLTCQLCVKVGGSGKASAANGAHRNGAESLFVCILDHLLVGAIEQIVLAEDRLHLNAVLLGGIDYVFDSRGIVVEGEGDMTDKSFLLSLCCRLKQTVFENYIVKVTASDAPEVVEVDVVGAHTCETALKMLTVFVGTCVIAKWTFGGDEYLITEILYRVAECRLAV